MGNLKTVTSNPVGTTDVQRSDEGQTEADSPDTSRQRDYSQRAFDVVRQATERHDQDA